nr:YegP family protein [uncultured Draconibacterium sp.]
MSNAKFIIEKSSNNEFNFSLQSPKGDVLAISENYTRKQKCYVGIFSVRYNAKNDRFEARRAENGKHYFVLLATNGRVLLISQKYDTEYKSACASSAVKNYAETADILERIHK